MAAPSIAELVAPGQCALVTQECQVAVIGTAAVLPALAEEAHRQAVPNMAALVAAARPAGVPVVHCLMWGRDDGLGAATNARLFAATRALGIRLEPGSPEAAVIPELGATAADVTLGRYHGIGPLAGAGLDGLLRNLGVRTIVGVGVSVNVGMTSFVMDAVNLGYRFVLCRDAVAGHPRAYAESVIDGTLALLASITTTAEVVAAWAAAAPPADLA